MAKFIKVKDSVVINLDNVSSIYVGDTDVYFYGNYPQTTDYGGRMVTACIAEISRKEFDEIYDDIMRDRTDARMCIILQNILEVLRFRLH